ncbi:sialidase family protein [Janthinobacterium sp. 17J80-10]|uniref:sialidase family protein n=1 Tax=Janthinobacterium sp. 17J80-10 TaxID=2497863 RepID=UPI001F504CB4|nr:sialidase family protein [Janthinobacterium sp. 17J80-10]
MSRVRYEARTALAMLYCVLAFAAGSAQSAHAHEEHAAPRVAGRTELGTSAAVDREGHLWVATKESLDGGDFVVLRQSADLGKTWSAPRKVQQAPEPVAAGGDDRPKLAFGSKGEIYVAYTRPIAKPHVGEIRFARSLDGGRSFSDPVTVHANRDRIAHAFGSMIVDGAGRIYIAWIDGRGAADAKAQGMPYRGSAVYYAVSDDAGNSFRGDYRLADHSCECCRIAMALTPDGKPVALWRHVFEPNARDHAIAVLAPDGKGTAPARATFDDWRIDACPHHGPGLAYADDGTRHQVWFNLKGDEGGVFHASVSPAGVMGTPQRLGTAQAAHADVAVLGKHVVLAWRQFDGKGTAILGKHSGDGGLTWRDMELARTSQGSDQPRLLKTPDGIVLAWRTQQEGMRIVPVIANAAVNAEK